MDIRQKNFKTSLKMVTKARLLKWAVSCMDKVAQITPVFGIKKTKRGHLAVVCGTFTYTKMF